jgi:hypothetical protein
MKRLILTMIAILFSTLTLCAQSGSFDQSSMSDSTEAKHHHNKQHNKQHGHHPHHHSSITARR